MKSFTGKKLIWLSFVFVFCFGAGFDLNAQTKKRKPLYQPITIQPGKSRPRTTPTPLVKKTSSTRPIVTPAKKAPVLRARTTPYPALGSVYIPGYSGILVESENGRVVMDSYSNHAFNPASNVKVATAYAVLRTFGPGYRFKTGVWTDGYIDRATKTLDGNLYVSGRDPILNHEHAISIAHELNRLGVNKIDGDLIVTSNFAMNFSNSTKRSAASLMRTMNAVKRTSAANRAWREYVSNSGRYLSTIVAPSVFFTGDSYVQMLPSNATLLLTHESAPLREIVKATMSYSNNFLSERLGDMLGGAYRVEQIVQRDARVAPFEFNLQTCSGLGINRVTPRAQMKLLRTFKKMLGRYGMRFSDVMPVAGLDDGTLKKRFKDGFQLGSVVGKTGTLRQTDRGVSTLSGEITTRQGKFFFVIFNQRGNVYTFRSFQNSFVPLLQSQLGGARSMGYVPVPMGRRLAKSRVTRPVRSFNRVED